MVAGRILGVFAHPDDEVFCVGGTMAKYVEQGAEAMVVSATRGEAGQIRDAAVATRTGLGAAREAELREACARLGVQQVRFFDYIDGTLAGVDAATLRDQIGAVLDEFRPDVVVTFGPDGFYGHPDHVTMGALTTEAFLARGRGRLFHSHFARSRLLLIDRLAEWLADMQERFKSPAGFARVFSLFAKETNTLGYANDHVEIAWFPPGVYIVEQGETGDGLYLILSGQVAVSQSQPDGSQTFIRTQGPGEFFGELAVARRTSRTANVVAVEAVTCMVFTRGTQSGWTGRGSDATLVPTLDAEDSMDPAPGQDAAAQGATAVIDVRSVIDRKLAAIAAHRTQYPIEPEMFPNWLVAEMLGHEYFVRVHPAPELERDLFG